MGITPITGLTPLPLARTLQADLDPLPMERVENSPRTADETYSPRTVKPPRGSEDDASDDDPEDPEEPADAPTPQTGPSGQISFFA
jgi:hypothetical protein